MKLELISRPPENDSNKPPILFVHGAFAGAWCWEENFLPYFSQNNYPSHALSFRGHGQSAGYETLFINSLSDYLEDLRNTVRQFDLPPVLVGHSMGGLVVQNYLEAHEHLPAVLLASVPKTGLWPASVQMFFREPLLFQKLLGAHMMPPMGVGESVFSLSLKDIRDIFFSENLPPEALQKHVSQFQPESVVALMELNRINFYPGNGELSSPILVAGAEKDNIITPGFISDMAESYGTRPHIFRNIGHTMMLDTGWKTVADYILKWLETNGL